MGSQLLVDRRFAGKCLAIAKDDDEIVNEPESRRAANLHTAARRYCMQNIQHWTAVYTAMPERDELGDYSEEAYRTFPRYNVLGAILEAVETIEPARLPSLDAVRSGLVEAAAADNSMTRRPNNPIEQVTMEEERRKFAGYVASLPNDELDSVEPLFYRRKLRADEVKSIAADLKKRWLTDMRVWYPLDDKPAGVDVEAFHVDLFGGEVGYERLKEAMARHGVTRVFEIDEGGDSGYELDVADTEPVYGGVEIWWTDRAANFVIYASHESSITFGGWVLDEIRTLWPAWRSRIYTRWDQT